jgi:hypothetical protein
MIHDEEDAPRSSMRSIPPVSGSPASGALSQRQETSWVWALATLGIMASVPFLLQHVASVGQPSLSSEPEAAAGGESLSEPSEQNLRTEVVREAPLHTAGATRGEGAHRTVAVVPRSAVSSVDGKTMVFVAEKELRLLVATPVELGSTEGSDQRILSGLSAGQVVVTENVASLEKLALRK